jgi:uncharacterized Zn finger protein (UPF0148 family)
MADLLRQGSTLTELACPACASPLFRLRNDNLWCASCEKKVIVVKEEDESRIRGSMALENLEATLLTKIQDIQNRMQREENAEELQKLGVTLSGLLENLERIGKVKKS